MAFSGKPKRDLTWKHTPIEQLSLSGRTALVVGGTSGIGRAFALSMAARGASVRVVGRSFKDQGNPRLSFIGAELSSMQEAKRLGETLEVDPEVVVFTTGIMAAPHREETQEGLERDMAVSYLSRLAILSGLAPRLAEKARAGGPRPRVFIMGFPGLDSKADVDDLTGEKHYSPMKVHMNTVVGNEALVLDFARRFPEVDFFGLNPGIIKTGIRSNFLGEGSLKHRVSETLIGLLTRTPEQYAARAVPLLWAPELSNRSGAMFNSKADAIEPSASLTPGVAEDFTHRGEALVERAVRH